MIRRIRRGWGLPAVHRTAAPRRRGAAIGNRSVRHPMKSQFTLARVAYGSVATFFWMASGGQVIIAFTPRGQKGSLLITALIFTMIGIIPFLKYRYWSRRGAESNARPRKVIQEE